MGSDPLHYWYAATLDRLREDGSWPRGELIASWRRLARPTMAAIGEPTREERRRHPGRYVESENAQWLERRPDVYPPSKGAGPLGTTTGWELVPGAGGAYVQIGNTIIRDRDEALRLTGAQGAPAAFIAMLLPSGRRRANRGRGVDHATLARALVLASLRVRLDRLHARRGLRPAARLVILWDSELNGPLGDNRTADLVRRYQARDPLAIVERAALTRAESSVITTSRRVWRSIRLIPETVGS